MTTRCITAPYSGRAYRLGLHPLLMGSGQPTLVLSADQGARESPEAIQASWPHHRSPSSTSGCELSNTEEGERK